jgi:DNA polymerase-1
MGDAVDNIPGIPGVGQKTACKLLTEYGTLENVLANADKIKGALGEKVRQGKESAILSKKLARIITNVPVQFHEEDYRLKEMNKEALKEVFGELGEEFNVFKTAPEGVQTDLFGNVIETAKSAAETIAPEEELPDGFHANNNISNTAHNYQVVEGAAAIKKLVTELKKHSEISFDTETTGIDGNNAELVGMCLVRLIKN